MSIEHGRASSDKEKLQGAHNLVVVLKQADYMYQLRQTHEDERPVMHFFRKFDDNLYPHFHLIVSITEENVNIHVDTARHKASYLEREIPHEIARLRNFLSQTKFDYPEQSRMQDFLNKKLTEIAFFGHDDSQEQEMRKQNLFKGVGLVKKGPKKLAGRKFKL